jgi:hypothetical protein
MKIPQSGYRIDEPSFLLLKTMISYSSASSADGAATGLTIVDSGLLTEPSYDGMSVKILSGPAAGQVREIASHPAPSNTISVGAAFTDSAGAVVQITAGTLYVILSTGAAGGGGSSGLAGVTQVIQIPVTSAANAGDVLLATVAGQECLIKKVNVRSNGATTVDLTNIGIYAGAAKVVTLIDNVTGARANIAAEDQQEGSAPEGGVALSVAKTIVITLTGTGATAVNLTVTIEYEACADGGHLV